MSGLFGDLMKVVVALVEGQNDHDEQRVSELFGEHCRVYECTWEAGKPTHVSTLIGRAAVLGYWNGVFRRFPKFAVSVESLDLLDGALASFIQYWDYGDGHVVRVQIIMECTDYDGVHKIEYVSVIAIDPLP